MMGVLIKTHSMPKFQTVQFQSAWNVWYFSLKADYEVKNKALFPGHNFCHFQQIPHQPSTVFLVDFTGYLSH